MSSFTESFLANLISGAILFTVSLIIVNGWIERQRRDQDRRMQQQLANESRNELVIAYLELINKEVQGLNLYMPVWVQEITGRRWNRWIFISTPAWNSLKQNSELLSTLSIEPLMILMDFYNELEGVKECLEILVNTWFEDKGNAPDFIEKQRALEFEVITRLTLTRDQGPSIQKILESEIQRLKQLNGI